MTWGDQALLPGDRIVTTRNHNLWWLVVGCDSEKVVLLYCSPEHLRVGEGYGKGATAIFHAYDLFASDLRVEHRSNQ